MDIAQPGQGISRDLGRGEAVEHELTAFIEKRHEQRVKSEGEPGRLAVVVSVPGARLPGAGGRVRTEGGRTGDRRSNPTGGSGMNEREIRQALEAGHFGHFDHLKK